jgi:hypothetical protein
MSRNSSLGHAKAPTLGLRRATVCDPLNAKKSRVSSWRSKYFRQQHRHATVADKDVGAGRETYIRWLASAEGALVLLGWFIWRQKFLDHVPHRNQEQLFELFLSRFTGNEIVRERHRERVVKTLFLECSTLYQRKLIKDFLALGVVHWFPQAG